MAVRALAASARKLTDGYISVITYRRLAVDVTGHQATQAATALGRIGFWQPVDGGGWQVVRWEQYAFTAEQVGEYRSSQAEKASAGGYARTATATRDGRGRMTSSTEPKSQPSMQPDGLDAHRPVHQPESSPDTDTDADTGFRPRASGPRTRRDESFSDIGDGEEPTETRSFAGGSPDGRSEEDLSSVPRAAGPPDAPPGIATGGGIGDHCPRPGIAAAGRPRGAERATLRPGLVEGIGGVGVRLEDRALPSGAPGLGSPWLPQAAHPEPVAASRRRQRPRPSSPRDADPRRPGRAVKRDRGVRLRPDQRGCSAARLPRRRTDRRGQGARAPLPSCSRAMSQGWTGQYFCLWHGRPEAEAESAASSMGADQAPGSSSVDVGSHDGTTASPDVRAPEAQEDPPRCECGKTKVARPDGQGWVCTNPYGHDRSGGRPDGRQDRGGPLARGIGQRGPAVNETPVRDPRAAVLVRYHEAYLRHLDGIDRGADSERHRLAAWLLERAARGERDDPACGRMTGPATFASSRTYRAAAHNVPR